MIEKLLAFITTFESGHEVLTKCQALALPYEWRVKERKYYFPCIDVCFLVCPLTFSYAKLNERRQINHNLIDKPPIIFSEITEQKFSSKPSCLSWCKGKNGLAEEEDDINKQHFNFTSSKYTVKQHWIIREQEAKWSSVFPDKIKINLMQLKIHKLLNIFNVT